MKIAVIGAAGVRTPLLVHGLAEVAGQIPLEKISLYDMDQERLQPMSRVARAMARHCRLEAELRAFPSVDEAVAGADVIISSIRSGDIAARVVDEQVALNHGLLGQETVGAGGFACAMRNLTAMMEIARAIERSAPNATLINFTNPVGIVSQGLLNHTRLHVIGVCDTPLETFESIAHALDLNPFDLHFEYFGLNHLGWIKAVRDGNGVDLLPGLMNSPERLERCYRHGLFPPDFLHKLGLLPTEYLYFYYFPDRARDNTKRSGQSRGQLIEQLNQRLFPALAAAPEADLVPIYENYLRERNASYFSIEATAGASREDDRPLYSQFSGYERIAILLLTGLYSDRPRSLPLTVRNQGAMPELLDSDSVELPCAVSRAGAIPQAPGPVPAQVLELLQTVKQYERWTAEAAVRHDRSLALQALGQNPVVGPERAAGVLNDYMKAFAPLMGLA